MNITYRILGKRGRITIPVEMRQRVGFAHNDVLSFAEAEDGQSLRKEPMNKSSSAEQRVFSARSSSGKRGNTPSIPPFSPPPSDEKSLAVRSCRFNHRFLIRRESICDHCKGAAPGVPWDEGRTLLEDLNRLTGDEQRTALIHLLVMWTKRREAE